ncbi:hypothetical protein V7S43_016040 [Phytophthora oleae]|uniref:Crinkler effector protein N-terminal domain-containing protein n=1 Tax=Phytophthora oleae TaxID=2107226 RepID=A0ABD3EYY5_9STRA
MVKFFCAIVGVEKSVFEVGIEERASVSALKFKIKDLNDDIKVSARNLELFLAKRDKGRGEWLTEEEAVKDDMRLEITKEEVAKLISPVNVLVLVPRPQMELWLVSGSVKNALSTKGIRSRVYRLAASYLGYYDPDLRAGDGDKAMWYEEATLQLHVVFKEERDAFIFENELQNEVFTRTSPLEGHDVSTKVAPIHRESNYLRRILTPEYLPDDTDSLQDTMTSVSTDISIVDLEADDSCIRVLRVSSASGVWGRQRAVI